MLATNHQILKMKLYQKLEQTYHDFFDELSRSELPAHEIGQITQAALLSRQDSLKHLVSQDEIDQDYLASSDSEWEHPEWDESKLIAAEAEIAQVVG